MNRKSYRKKTYKRLDRARLFFTTPQWFLRLRRDPNNKGKSDHDLITMHYSVPCTLEVVRTGEVLNHGANS